MPVVLMLNARIKYGVFWFFHKPKNKFFSKTLKISAPNSFFPKNDKNLLFIGGLFQQVSVTWNEICVKEARRLKSKIEFRRLMEKMKKRFWTSWRSTKSTDTWRSGGGFGRRICKVGKGAQVENYYFIGFSAQASTLGVFFIYTIRFRPGIYQPFSGCFGSIFTTKRIFETTVLLLKKAARCHPFLAVFVWQPLAAQTL